MTGKARVIRLEKGNRELVVFEEIKERNKQPVYLRRDYRDQ